MSDQAEESRPSTEGTGGWHVPKNAMSEQEIAAAKQSNADSGIPMPASMPEQDGAWYVPPDAADRVAALAPDADASSDPNLPAGAAVSTEADYSNYVPGVGFVKSGQTVDTTNAAAAESAEDAFVSTGAEPAAASVQEDEGAAQYSDPSSIYVPQSEEAKPAESESVPVSEQSAAQSPAPEQAAQAESPAEQAPTKIVNPELIKRYEDVEKSVQALRRKYNAGTITRSQLQEELRKLMILDDEGFWWMIGMESDRWYKYNGKDWTPAARPGKSDEPAKVADPLSRLGGTPSDSAPKAPLLESEESTPLPKRVPLVDPSATVVGLSAPRLDNTLKTPKEPVKAEPSTPPRYFDRAAGKSADTFDGGVTVPHAAAGSGEFDGGVTMPMGSSQVTQPNVPVTGVPAPGAFPGRAPAPVGGGSAGAVGTPRLAPGQQPDYGEPPRGFLADRQRTGSCLIQAAMLTFFLALVGTLITIGVLVMGYFSIIGVYESKIAQLPSLVEAGSQSARILDKNGRLLYQINDPNLGAKIRVPLNQISPDLIAAIIATEDQRYYENPGFDIIGMGRSILQNIRAGATVTGASTITQQLARGFVLDPGAAQDRSIGRKINEVVVASELARRYSKSDIIEYYLNYVYFGNLAYGAEAAAQQYFGKSAKDLNRAEAAFLAGMIQSPATYDPVVNRQVAMDRMDQVLVLMGELGCIQMEHEPYTEGLYCINQEDINNAAVLVANVKARNFRPPTNNAIYPHFVNYVQQQLEERFGKDALYTSGFSVYTTIDPKMQDLADQAVKNQIARLRNQNVTNGAVLAIRPADGAILVMVGSADFNNRDIDGQFNVTLAPRQPGSSIKPFVYLASFERDPNNNYYTPGTVIWDVQTCFGGSPPYCPRNYDDRFHGPQTVRSALANSYNIPAVKALQYVGIDRFKQFGQRVGLTFPLTQPENAGLPMALGGVEVPLIDMVHGYSVIANGGKRVEPYSIAKVTRKAGENEEVVFEAKDFPSQQVVEPALAFLMTSILSDQQARAPAFGNALNLQGNRPAAVKTGTTNDSKDNWTIGFTPQLVVGVWVGNSNNSPMIGTSGVTGAAPIWRDVMQGALADQPVMQFQQPPQIGQANICADFGTQDFQECKNRRTELFFQPNPPPAADAVFKTLQVDTFTGLIANANCPDYVENRRFLAVDDPTAVAWLNNDPAGQQWARDRGITLPVVPPPTQECDPNSPRPQLRVVNPQPNQTVNGLLEIRGSVFVPNFAGYQIEVGNGLNATSFQIVDGPIRAQPSGENSFLGRWDTASVPNGAYTLRLSAFDAQGHTARITMPLIVNNLAPTATQIIVPPTSTPDFGLGQPTATTDPFGGQPGTEPTPIIIDPNPPTATTDPNVVAPTPTDILLFPPTTAP